MFHLSFFYRNWLWFRFYGFRLYRTISLWMGYLKRHVGIEKGVDSLRRRSQDHCLIFCDLRHFIVGSYSMLNWWYLYMFIVFILHTCVYGIAWFCRFFYIINVCHDFFNELCKYIMYNCRLMLISICWYMSCCKIDDWHHNTCDICAYCMILFDFWISLEYFQDY